MVTQLVLQLLLDRGLAIHSNVGYLFSYRGGLPQLA